MDLRQLRYFLAVMEHGSFTAAARAVPVSQPALSLAIRQLEQELGAQLFLRLGRKVQPTVAGRALAEPARRALRDVASGRAAVAEVVGLEAGWLSLCALPTLAADPLAGLIGAFRATHPGVSVELAAPENPPELVQLLLEGRCELGVCEELVQSDRHAPLEQVALGEQELWVIMPPGWPNEGEGDGARSDRFSLEALSHVPLVATPEGTSSRRLLDEGLASVGRAPTVAVETAQRDAVVPLVVAGAGAALVPPALARAAAALGALALLPTPRISRRTTIAYLSAALTPAGRRFVELASGSWVAATP